MNEWKGWWMNGRVDEWMEGLMNEWNDWWIIKRSMNEYNEWMEGLMSECKDWWVNVRIDEWM